MTQLAGDAGPGPRKREAAGRSNGADTRERIIQAATAEFKRLILGILADGVTEGSFAVKDPIITANVIITACDYAFMWLKASPERPIDVIAARYGELTVAMASGGAR